MDRDAAPLPEIEACWCGTAPEEEARAIRTSIALYDKLARRTAATLGFNTVDAFAVAREVDRLLGSGDLFDDPER